jgi:hypothetical protein
MRRKAYQMTAPKADYFLRTQCGVVHAGKKRHQPLAPASLRTDCGEQALRLIDVDDDARVHRLKSPRPCRLHALDGVNHEDAGLACVIHHAAEHYALAVSGVRRGCRAVFLSADAVQQDASAQRAAAWMHEFFQRDGGTFKPAHNIGQVCWRLAFPLQLQEILDLRASIDRRTVLIEQYREEIADLHKDARYNDDNERTKIFYERADQLDEKIRALEGEIEPVHERIRALQGKISPDDLAFLGSSDA